MTPVKERQKVETPKREQIRATTPVKEEKKKPSEKVRSELVKPKKGKEVKKVEERPSRK